MSKLLPFPPKEFSAMPPTSVAPSVLAIVLRLRIAELVSSSSFLNFANKFPFLGEEIFKFSISADVTLKIMASSVEQSAEMPIVREIAETSSIDIATGSVGL